MRTVREGGVVHAWNQDNAATAVCVDDVVVAVNGKATYEEMMAEFKSALNCTVKVRRAIPKSEQAAERQGVKHDTEAADEAADEAAKWEQRKARVTAALIPGLKKIVGSEFGPGAADRIGRVEQLYQRVGRNEVFEEETPLGRRYAPGYVEGLEPVQPFHRTEDHPWCAELRSHWKAIRTELRNCIDEGDDCPWTPGAYVAANEAYGQDWKIMGVFTADAWMDEKRFKVTTRVLKQLTGVKISEAFFARMPGGTKIAPHSDNLNYILTSHLALELEAGTCAIKVGNSEELWKEGEMLVFDTAFIHSTRNDSSKPRYVLVVRFWHPGLSEEERRAIHVSHAILASTGQKK